MHPGRGRLAIGHAHRGPGPELSRAAPWMALRLRAPRALSLGASRRNERLQGTAAPLGERIDPGGAEAPASPLEVARAISRQAGVHVPPHLQRGLRVPPSALAHPLPGRARALPEPQHPVHDRGHDPVRDRDQLRPLLLRIRAAGDEARLAEAAPLPAVHHVAGDGALGYEYARRSGGSGRPPEPVPPDAQVPDRAAGRPLAGEALPRPAERVGGARDRAGDLFRVGDDRARPSRNVRAATVFRSVSLRLSLRGDPLPGPRARPLLTGRAARAPAVPAGPREP